MAEDTNTGVLLTVDAAKRTEVAVRKSETDGLRDSPNRPHLPRPTTLLASGGGGVRFGVVVRVENPNNRFVHCKAVKRSSAVPWDGVYVYTDDEPAQVWLWPPLRADRLIRFVWEGPEVTDDTAFLPVEKVQGIWHIRPWWDHDMRDWPADGEFSDCQ